MTRGLLIGTALGLLLGAAFVGITSDWSWLVFTVTLGWALGIGIGLEWARTTRGTPQKRRETRRV